jgi:DNA-binding response OmpR family regulator
MVGTQATVLLVNSFDDGRDMYAEYLRYHGFAVRGINEPEAALSLKPNETPDIVVTDVIFPESDMDGAALIRALRRRPDYSEVPIIVVSGLVRSADRERTRAAGADRFLIKPCLPDQLLSEVEAALSCRRERRRPPWNWPGATAEVKIAAERRRRPD